MTERYNDKTQTASQDPKKINPAKNSVKYIVPMPGRSSWILKSSNPNGDCMNGCDLRGDFTSDSSMDHSHHIMDRKFIID